MCYPHSLIPTRCNSVIPFQTPICAIGALYVIHGTSVYESHGTGDNNKLAYHDTMNETIICKRLEFVSFTESYRSDKLTYCYLLQEQ